MVIAIAPSKLAANARTSLIERFVGDRRQSPTATSLI
jgi:hypothetical protein